MKSPLLKLIYRPVVKWAARRTLVGRNRCRDKPEQGRFNRAEVDNLLDQVWCHFDRFGANVPREATVGSRMNMMLACMSLSFFRVLCAVGVERDYAIELFVDVAWRVYEKWGVVPRVVARLPTRDPVKQMRICVNLFLRFPFNPPGYLYTRLPTNDGISFDMHRCPVADYFRSNNTADLCVGSWCNLDYGLAEMWGGWLERAGTLAGGDDRCSFRFKAAS